jgi:hypothetical protein
LKKKQKLKNVAGVQEVIRQGLTKPAKLSDEDLKAISDHTFESLKKITQPHFELSQEKNDWYHKLKLNELGVNINKPGVKDDWVLVFILLIQAGAVVLEAFASLTTDKASSAYKQYAGFSIACFVLALLLAKALESSQKRNLGQLEKESAEEAIQLTSYTVTRKSLLAAKEQKETLRSSAADVIMASSAPVVPEGDSQSSTEACTVLHSSIGEVLRVTFHNPVSPTAAANFPGNDNDRTPQTETTKEI